jgi:hypothetical protein
MPKKYKDFIPKPLGKRVEWYEFEIENIAAKGAEMGLTGTEITNYTNHCQNQIDKIKAVAKIKAALAAAMKDFKTTAKIDNPAIRVLATKMKASDGFTPGRGAFLKIIDTHITLDFEFYKPELEIEVFNGYVRLIFEFNGLEAMHIYHRLTGTSDWGEPFAKVRHAPFDDHSLMVITNPPKTSEAPEYMIIGIMDDEEVGFTSDIHPAIFGG